MRGFLEPRIEVTASGHLNPYELDTRLADIGCLLSDFAFPALNAWFSVEPLDVPAMFANQDVKAYILFSAWDANVQAH